MYVFACFDASVFSRSTVVVVVIAAVPATAAVGAGEVAVAASVVVAAIVLAVVVIVWDRQYAYWRIVCPTLSPLLRRTTITLRFSRVPLFILHVIHQVCKYICIRCSNL